MIDEDRLFFYCFFCAVNYRLAVKNRATTNLLDKTFCWWLAFLLSFRITKFMQVFIHRQNLMEAGRRSKKPDGSAVEMHVKERRRHLCSACHWNWWPIDSRLSLSVPTLKMPCHATQRIVMLHWYWHCRSKCLRLADCTHEPTHFFALVFCLSMKYSVCLSIANFALSARKRLKACFFFQAKGTADCLLFLQILLDKNETMFAFI